MKAKAISILFLSLANCATVPKVPPLEIAAQECSKVFEPKTQPWNDCVLLRMLVLENQAEEQKRIQRQAYKELANSLEEAGRRTANSIMMQDAIRRGATPVWILNE